VTEALAMDPSGMLAAIDRQVRDLAIAAAGIYDFQIHHDQILEAVVVRHWAIESVEGLDEAGEKARTSALRHISRVGKAAKRLARHRESVPA
jgi:acyl-[acyl-carrier-protein] desaturase